MEEGEEEERGKRMRRKKMRRRRRKNRLPPGCGRITKPVLGKGSQIQKAIRYEFHSWEMSRAGTYAARDSID